MYCYSFFIFRSVCSYCHKWVYISTYKKAYKGTCARPQRKINRVAILQYRRCNITIWKKKWGNNSRRQATKARSCRGKSTKEMTKNTHFIGGNGLKSTYLSMVCRLSNSCEEWFSWVECTALNWIFHRLDIFFSSLWKIFFALLKNLFHYSDNFFSSLEFYLKKPIWQD